MHSPLQFLLNRPAMFKETIYRGVWKLTDEFRIRWTKAVDELQDASLRLKEIWPEVAQHGPNGVNKLVEVSAKITKLTADIKEMTTP